MRGEELLVVLTFTACVESGGGKRSLTAAQQRSAESGFTGRAAAAHASGIKGNIPGTPKELAAINACLKAKASDKPTPRAGQPIAAQAPVATDKTCRNTMVGGDSYACVPI